MNGTAVRRSPGRKGTPQAEPKSKLAQTVAEVLSDHVVLETESIDRMYLNVFVGRLQILEGARFIRQQREAKVLSTNAVEPMTRAFVQSIEQFVKDHQIPLVTFEKGQRKDEVPLSFGRSFRSVKESSSSARRRRSVPFIAPRSDTMLVATQLRYT